MVNILRSIGYSLVGLSTLGWLCVFLIGMMITKGADTWLTTIFADHLVQDAKLSDFNRSFSDVQDGIFNLLVQLNLILLSLTVLMTLGWSVGSHYLNIDAPGKAKIYFIHWAVYSGILIGLIILISIYFLTSTRFDNAFISGDGSFYITLIMTVYYSVIYYIGVLVGTARFARSSVLLANKLPGSF
jgi:hypothetical protein